MALRDQPYIPLYVQDLLSDEKLVLCSAEAHGIYLRLLCILHKQDVYGKICLKQKHKQNVSKFENFACVLARQMPFEQRQIAECLEELNDEGVIAVSENELYQKRMLRDGEISAVRSESGKKGGPNAPTSKQYGVAGYVYLMSDTIDKHKIGISSNPKNRLYRIRSVNKLHKLFDIIKTVSVDDMGSAEDVALQIFDDIRDGEWIVADYDTVLEKFADFEAKLQAKVRAKAQAKNKTNSEIEYEYINANKNKDGISISEKSTTRVREEKSLFEKTIDDFVKMRKKLKCEPTDRALELIRNKLEKLAPDDEAMQIRILEQSIERGWRGVFPLKEDGDWQGGAPAKPQKKTASGIVADMKKKGVLTS